MTWGLESKVTIQRETHVKVLLTEKEVSVTEPGFPFIIPGHPLRGWPGRWDCRTSCG